MTSTSTGRLYASAQNDFAEWCEKEGISDPGHQEVARYLEACCAERGPSTVFQRLSALTNLFRSQGVGFDTKLPEIQRVTEKARAMMRNP